ncbi:MAG: hypothetical protein OEV44_00190 [Spirochaetota bacterium]|nr:hypothetical protein [Spirochaetota bacterium]
MDLLTTAIKAGFKIENNKSIEQSKYLLLCEIQQWLRDEHGILVLCWTKYHPQTSYSIIIWFYKIAYTDKNIISNYDYNSYESALKEGLEEAIKLIK